MSTEFTKYRLRGAYHWREVSRHPTRGWPYTRSRIDWVVRQCAQARTVLEIGCGDAALLARLARQGKVVTGIDSDATALQIAQAMFGKHGLDGAFHAHLDALEEATFDAVVLAEVIEHVDDVDPLLVEIVRRLDPGGRLVLTTPIRLLERSPDPHHVHEFWPDELSELLERYFESVRLSRLHPAWLIDLMCVSAARVRPFAILANLLKMATGIELMDVIGSPNGLYWTQAVVATRPRKHAMPAAAAPPPWLEER